MGKLDSSRLFYYIGTNPSHIIHALPLYKQVGGKFIVASKEAERSLSRYKVPIVRIDDINLHYVNQLDRVRSRLGLNPSSLRLGKNLKNTFNYLEQNADIVLFYELLEFTNHTKLSKPKTIFMTHGNMLKDYMGMHPHRLRMIESYNYMAALSPYLHKKFIKHGIPAKKLVEIGTARNDSVVKLSNSAHSSYSPAEAPNIDPDKTIVAYMPTYWSPSSVQNVGLEIVKNFPSSMQLIFRPHPSTPSELMDKYKEIIRSRDDGSVIYAPNDIMELDDILQISSVIIGDTSSVMLEAILLNKPLIFAETSDPAQSNLDYDSIQEIVEYSEAINMANAKKVQDIVGIALDKGIDKNIWEVVKQRAFYCCKNDCIDKIIKFLDSISPED